eukprot:CAMPEP_0183349014 /NCGR_PEP_ID=MMETSP0164_2-20130417/13329_1 /TAXON_ID=221442 /ORGANISM="Coccolithus pelagicus ssp braarudi, Strain PLY182g" /LENGTH=78 /DNA_ID=CAMNT_0025520681 /DNA_START=194 /DNA_END=426 /DNA_ORIENTATION=-
MDAASTLHWARPSESARRGSHHPRTRAPPRAPPTPGLARADRCVPRASERATDTRPRSPRCARNQRRVAATTTATATA